MSRRGTESGQSGHTGEGVLSAPSPEGGLACRPHGHSGRSHQCRCGAAEAPALSERLTNESVTAVTGEEAACPPKPWDTALTPEKTRTGEEEKGDELGPQDVSVTCRDSSSPLLALDILGWVLEKPTAWTSQRGTSENSLLSPAGKEQPDNAGNSAVRTTNTAGDASQGRGGPSPPPRRVGAGACPSWEQVGWPEETYWRLTTAHCPVVMRSRTHKIKWRLKS